jgi:hypothetical protein
MMKTLDIQLEVDIMTIMNVKPPRKIKHRTHKDFGAHSFIVDESCSGQIFYGRKRNLGDKVVYPGDYGKSRGNYDNRSRAELRNVDDIKIAKQEDYDETR